MENKKISIHLLFLSFSFARNFPDSLEYHNLYIYIFIKFSTLDQSSLFQKLIHRSSSILLGKQNAKFEYFSCEFGWSKNNFEGQIEVHYRGLLWTTQEWNLTHVSTTMGWRFASGPWRTSFSSATRWFSPAKSLYQHRNQNSRRILFQNICKISITLVYIVVKETDKYFTIFSLFFLTKYEDCRGKCIFVFSIHKEKFLHFLRTDSKIENAFISLFSPFCFSFHISCNISFPNDE